MPETGSISVETLLNNHAALTLSTSDNTVKVKGANNVAFVTVANIKAGLSIIHIIDAVLVPLLASPSPSPAKQNMDEVKAAIVQAIHRGAPIYNRYVHSNEEICLPKKTVILDYLEEVNISSLVLFNAVGWGNATSHLRHLLQW